MAVNEDRTDFLPYLKPHKPASRRLCVKPAAPPSRAAEKTKRFSPLPQTPQSRVPPTHQQARPNCLLRVPPRPPRLCGESFSRRVHIKDPTIFPTLSTTYNPPAPKPACRRAISEPSWHPKPKSK